MLVTDTETSEDVIHSMLVPVLSDYCTVCQLIVIADHEGATHMLSSYLCERIGNTRHGKRRW